MVNQTKLSQAHDRLISLSYQMAAILSQMLEQGDVPAWYAEAARHAVRHHAAAAKSRKEALNEA